MTHDEYMKNEINWYKKQYKEYNYGTPYICECGQEVSDIRQSTLDEVLRLLDKAERVWDFSEEDGCDGGLIERVAYQFDKLLPVNNDFDMRDYTSFAVDGEEGEYYVFFIDSWPNDKKDRVTTLEQLADYINSMQVWKAQVEEIIEKNGWESDFHVVGGVCHDDNGNFVEIDEDGNAIVARPQ